MRCVYTYIYINIYMCVCAHIYMSTFYLLINLINAKLLKLKYNRETHTTLYLMLFQAGYINFYLRDQKKQFHDLSKSMCLMIKHNALQELCLFRESAQQLVIHFGNIIHPIVMFKMFFYDSTERVYMSQMQVL